MRRRALLNEKWEKRENPEKTQLQVQRIDFGFRKIVHIETFPCPLNHVLPAGKFLELNGRQQGAAHLPPKVLRDIVCGRAKCLYNMPHIAPRKNSQSVKRISLLLSASRSAFASYFLKDEVFEIQSRRHLGIHRGFQLQHAPKDILRRLQAAVQWNIAHPALVDSDFWFICIDNGKPMRVIKVSMEQSRNERAGETGFPRKPVDQRHRPARFPHAKIRSDPTGD
ncbi:hypothetical protein PR048_009789 [Dryococelus australis]|uniref:Uncharacterized protein n=1 Tax=Dryococelus australis TaxID=614101 RepID=A0ABQ9I0V7_9NEOP|nr:hypothetical protein PR048_009789 [Dryococelus australis]